MTEFKRFNSIENSYNQRNILKHLEYNPQLQTMEFVLREKLDGANIQLFFFPGEPERRLVGKRTSFLNRSDTFFDIWSTLEKFDAEVRILQNYSNTSGRELRVFGELYGPGINGRVKYGSEKKIALFDMYENSLLLSQKELEDTFKKLELTHMLPPLVGRCIGLSPAVDFSETFNSWVLGIDNNPAEGLVINPYTDVVRQPNGERFILKKKSEKFAEKGDTKPNKSPKIPVSGEVLSAIAGFREYVNPNRVLSTFSKHGPITEQSQMGDYIRLIRDDAIADFLKDNPNLVMDDDTTRKVFDVGKDIVKLLRAHL